jgi:hypothetical protein
VGLLSRKKGRQGRGTCLIPAHPPGIFAGNGVFLKSVITIELNFSFLIDKPKLTQSRVRAKSRRACQSEMMPTISETGPVADLLLLNLDFSY